VALPAFNEDGDLPPGVHGATLSEVLAHFGQGSVQRCAVADRLTRLYQLAAATGQVTRFVVFGSFVTAKAESNDIDIILLMKDTFDLAAVMGEAALMFQHLEAQARFGASVFWTRCFGAMGGEQAMIAYWQVRRQGGQRGIVEILPEGT
jgi:predicted nucleotidyltransferase